MPVITKGQIVKMDGIGTWIVHSITASTAIQRMAAKIPAPKSRAETDNCISERPFAVREGA